MKRTLGLVTFATLTTFAGLTLAEEQDRAAHHPPAAAPSAGAETSDAPTVEGVVRKVDKSAGKVTLKHGPIPNLGMPDMLMVFRVKDPAMLDEVKAGDKVHFSANKIDGAYTVTRIQRVD